MIHALQARAGVHNVALVDALARWCVRGLSSQTWAERAEPDDEDVLEFYQTIDAINGVVGTVIEAYLDK